MTEKKIFVGDTGTKLKFDVSVDAASIVLAKIKYQKPDGTTGEWLASPEAETYITYTTQGGDIDKPGPWQFQPYVELASGWKGRGTIVTLSVWPTLPS